MISILSGGESMPDPDKLGMSLIVADWCVGISVLGQQTAKVCVI